MRRFVALLLQVRIFTTQLRVNFLFPVVEDSVAKVFVVSFEAVIVLPSVLLVHLVVVSAPFSKAFFV